MKKFIILIFALFCCQNLLANKHALIIAVGDYPAKTGWGAISSVNDVPLIKQTLLNQGFLEENIEVLINEQATKKGIMEAMQRLKNRIAEGDIVVIHYSGHGQQIFDDNGEEIDGKDEALIPYDAFVKYTHNYKGENHLRDDELGNLMTSFRNKLGKNGQLLFLLDSCHSGSATRGAVTRGGEGTFAPAGWKASDDVKTAGSDMFERSKVSQDAAPFVMISGASADELNYEYEGYGSLSFAFSEAMNELGSDFTYRQLFAKIAANMNVISPKQTPTIEGDTNYKLFKGEYVAQQPYFEVTDITRPDLIRMNAGKIQRIFKNTTVKILPAGTTEVEEDKVLAKGNISNAKFNESIIKLDKALPTSNEKDFWVFIDEPSYGDISLKVYLDETVTDSEIKNGITDFLKQNNLGEVVADTLQADVFVMKDGESFTLNVSRGVETLNEINKERGTGALESINQKLFNFAQGQYLKNLSLKNEKYEFEFKLLPIEYDIETGTIGELKPETENLNEAGTFQVNTQDDFVVLQVTNKSDRPLYFSIIEINTQGEIMPFMPNDNCDLNDNERKLAPGQTMVFKDCIFSFGPPYEKLVLKGFATSSPINFQPTVQTRGEGTRSGNQNPLENFIQQSYSKSRGSGATSTSGGMEGYSTEFVYEIVEE